jgi:transcription antitermination factor NusB
MRKRTRARELATKFLYQADITGSKEITDAMIQAFLGESTDNPEVGAFATELVKGYWEKRQIIDKRIEEVSHNWKLDRMAAIDRNIIRLGAYELMFRTDVPALVSINEAIEMAKKFSTRKSGPFVNGLLDSLRKKYADHKPCGRDKQTPLPSGS